MNSGDNVKNAEVISITRHAGYRDEKAQKDNPGGEKCLQTDRQALGSVCGEKEDTGRDSKDGKRAKIGHRWGGAPTSYRCVRPGCGVIMESHVIDGKATRVYLSDSSWVKDRPNCVEDKS